VKAGCRRIHRDDMREAQGLSMSHLTDGSYVITTSSAEAVALYRKGVDLIVRSSADARSVLTAAVAADDRMAVALAALAHESRSEARVRSLLDRASHAARSATRRERQHVEVVMATLMGDLPRARALGAEHLADFPRDGLVVYLLRHE
jgi:hypothetical protein